MNYYREDDFKRRDETDDSVFYSGERMVQHLDDRALETVKTLIGSLVDEKSPVILDLMASWDTHLPESLNPQRSVGLGLNKNELRENERLDDFVVHDLNSEPSLPFKSQTFDAVINTVSVDYLVHPEEVFKEVGRVLKPGGLFLVIFSNRWFEPKVTNIWRRSSEPERVWLVESWMQETGLFEKPLVYTSIGKPRPGHDKYASLGLPSDPVFAVFSDRKGGQRALRKLPKETAPSPDDDELKARKRLASRTHECPYCGGKMSKWEVPQTPFTEWPNEYFYVCFNDHCAYLENGWQTMTCQGNVGWSYRVMYDDERDAFSSIPVQTLKALKEGIIE